MIPRKATLLRNYKSSDKVTCCQGLICMEDKNESIRLFWEGEGGKLFKILGGRIFVIFTVVWWPRSAIPSHVEGYEQVNYVLAEIRVLKNCTIYFFEQRSRKIVFQLLPKQLNSLHSISQTNLQSIKFHWTHSPTELIKILLPEILKLSTINIFSRNVNNISFFNWISSEDLEISPR